MKRADLEKLTPQELHQAKLAIDAQIDALREEKRAIAAVENRKVTEQALLAKLGNLNDGERAVLAQLVTADGIPSAEAFGTPGE